MREDATATFAAPINVDSSSELSRLITTSDAPLHIPIGHPALAPDQFVNKHTTC